MDYSPSPRSIPDKYRSLAIKIGLLLSLSLLQVQIQASCSTFYVGGDESTQNDGRVRQLEPGKPIERELAGGQTHSYQITLHSGQYLQVVVDQRGIDVVVALFAPDGEKKSEADSSDGIIGSETVSVIAEAAGTCRIEVRSLEKEPRPGRYEIKVVELREATANDRHRVTADSIVREAGRLRDGTLEARKKSIEKYQEALELYRIAGLRGSEAETLNNIGDVYWSLREMQKAMEKYNEALPMMKELGDRDGEATTLNNIGTVYRALGEMQKALEKYNEALPILRTIGDRSGEAVALNNTGVVYRSLGEMQKALEKYSEALSIKRALGDRSGEAVTLSNIGMVYTSMGEMQKALDKYNEALPIRRAVGDRSGEAVTLSNIGIVYGSLGELQKALDKFNEALPISRAVGDRSGQASTLNLIGEVYFSLGEMQKALDTFNKALPIRRAVGDRSGEAYTLHDLGRVYLSMGEMQKALEKYNEALPISRAVGDRSGEAATLNGIGSVYLSLGEMQKALEKFIEALPIKQLVDDRGGEAAILLGIARVEQKLGNLAQARQTIERALGIVESLRTNIASQELRASFLASKQGFYQTYIDILMQLHKQNPTASFDAIALGVSERARARSLLELLSEAHADIRQGVDSSLIERERTLKQRLTARAAGQINLLNRKHTSAQADAATKEIASITAEYEELEAQIRSSSPRYSALTQPQPLSLGEIQQQVLDPETLLLEYSLGEDSSYLFLVSNDSIASYQLPKRAEIENATRQVLELLTAPQPRPGEAASQRQARIREASTSYWPQAASLSRMLLGPAASQLGTKRLLIVTDGALQYLPFGVLPVPEIRSGRAGERKSGRVGELQRVSRSPAPPLPRSPALPFSHSLTTLIVEHEIVHLPSASTLAILRRELSGRKPAPKTVAVLADPVFSTDDARVKFASSDHKVLASDQAPLELSRALSDVRGDLSRLLMTRDEALAIFSVAPLNTRLEALDFLASRATATSDELSQYRIVHFATHGLLNSEHPQLSGLVLSLVDEHGQPEDGFLQLQEIFNLRLPAELVVLSACQTGLGKEIKGEGLVGLTRGFMYAGAARVLASLWQVDDSATAELMKRFYRRMLQDGMRPAAALRAAQIEMCKRPHWELPFYWGAFVLQGEWK